MSLSSVSALMSLVAGCMPISDRTTYTIRNRGKRLSGSERNEVCPCCGWFKKKKCNCRANRAQRSESD